jgi:acyl carrier protein
MAETDRIREFVSEEFLVEEDIGPLRDDSPLLEGWMDSLGLMRLVAFLEEEFDVQIDDVEITEENFRTVAHVARLVERSRSSS